MCQPEDLLFKEELEPDGEHRQQRPGDDFVRQLADRHPEGLEDAGAWLRFRLELYS